MIRKTIAIAGLLLSSIFTLGQTGNLFYPTTPCRLVDTRLSNGPLGGPQMAQGETRPFPVLSSPCNVPAIAVAYSLNITVVPGPSLSYLTIWPTGQLQPTVSTLNATSGLVTANAAIVPSGTGGQISIFVSNATHVIIDINGYFAPPPTLTSAQVYSPQAGSVMRLQNAYGDITTITQKTVPAGSSVTCNNGIVWDFTKNADRSYWLGGKELWFALCPEPDGSWVSTKSLAVRADNTNFTLEVGPGSGDRTYLFIPAAGVAGRTISVNSPYFAWTTDTLSWPSIINTGTPPAASTSWQTDAFITACPVTSVTTGTENCLVSHQQEACPGKWCTEESWYFASGLGPVMIVPIKAVNNPGDPNLIAKRIN